MDKRLFGLRLKERRESVGLSRADFAARLGVSHTMAGYYEQGRYTPTAERLYAVSRALAVSADYLLGLRDEP